MAMYNFRVALHTFSTTKVFRHFFDIMTSIAASRASMKPPTALYAALGTNLGDKVQNLEAALEQLQVSVGLIKKTSRMYQTAPQYVEDQPSFYNIVVQMETDMEPIQVLEAFKKIERDVGRVDSFRYGPRAIDVDLLFYGDEAVVTETCEGPLIVPHEKIHERDFVLYPFCDVNPDFLHPTLSKTMATLLSSLPSSETPPKPILPLQTSCLELTSQTYVMGILNVTPDSFSDGNDLPSISVAVEKAIDLMENGVSIVDIGGESSRPGAAVVSAEEEKTRVVPVIQAIRERVGSDKLSISVDTSKAEVAKAAIEAGANMVNDISGGLADEKMLSTVAQLGVPIVLMHMRGTPQTMTTLKEYDDVVTDVSTWLRERVDAALKAGVWRWNIVVDPGIGFAKGGELNLQLLRSLSQVKAECYDLPLLVGTSRKGFIGTICGRPEPKDRAWGTAATCSAAISQGADILRVHDAKEMVDVAKMSDAIWRV